MVNKEDQMERQYKNVIKLEWEMAVLSVMWLKQYNCQFNKIEQDKTVYKQKAFSSLVFSHDCLLQTLQNVIIWMYLTLVLLLSLVKK